MNENEKRQRRERAIVRGLIRALKSAGWQPVAVDDGGDTDETATTEHTMMTHAFGVDFATLKFAHEGHPRRCVVQIVPGNDGDVIHDYSAPDPDPAGFAAAVNAYCATLD